MIRALLFLLLLAVVPLLPAQDDVEAPALPKAAAAPVAADGKIRFFVIPVRDQIGQPILYIIRNGVKDAIAAGAQFVVLNMETPGGELGATLEIMEVLSKFGGTSVTFVNSEAVSAGAFISAATDQIYFAPAGVIGAAAPVGGSGEDIDQTMKQKVVSYLRARVRSISQEHEYRGDVVSAMMDENFELKIGDELIKPKGELLSLTATEAVQTYGDPPLPLLGAGIVEDLPALYRTLAAGAPFEVREFQMTWSIKLAQWLTNLAPLLLGLGGVLLFIEFKTPGFGVFGVAGIVLLLIVFFGHNLAGLSGHEPMLVFLLGVTLVFVEVFFFPGMLVFAIPGIILMLGSLLWGMADIWPGDAFELTPGTFLTPAFNLAAGFLISVVLVLAVLKFLPKSPLWDRMVLSAAIEGTAADAGPATGTAPIPTTGAEGTVVLPLRPTGEIEVDGQRYEARIEVGELPRGARVRIVRRADFVLIVEAVEPGSRPG